MTNYSIKKNNQNHDLGPDMSVELSKYLIALYEKKFEHFVWSAKYPLGRFTQWSKSRLRVTYRTSTKRLLRPYPTTYIYYYSQRPLIELDRIMTVELLAFWLGGLSIIQGWVTLLSQKSSW